MTFQILRILRISFTVADLDRTGAFYARLGFVLVGGEPLDDVELEVLGVPTSRADRLIMRLGPQEVEFLRFDPPGRAYTKTGTSTDHWFQHIAIVVDDMAAAYERALLAGAMPITRGPPQRLPPNTGQVTAFKFRDLDGHPLELLAFPPGVGDPVWHHEPGPSPFLGIDHTAIVVADVTRSRSFYEALGFAATSHSFNRGTAQTRLDDVEEDRVNVLALTLPETPPHLELLGYETGRRRSIPVDTRADDMSTRTIIEVETPDEAGASGSAAMIDETKYFTRKDPDGHVLVFKRRSH